MMANECACANGAVALLFIFFFVNFFLSSNSELHIKPKNNDQPKVLKIKHIFFVLRFVDTKHGAVSIKDWA